ncbi:MAG: hypothetical protein M3209_20665, partial [Acidobacteriota bacterium]|nr:hypothetical protein [Acidobacteriota bacterium]
MNVRERNLAVWRFLLLPLVFLTVALLGGLRVGAERQNFIFIPPPLVCLILASLLMLLFLRGRLIFFGNWISHDFPLLTNAANGITLLTLFFASAQALNSALPESGFLFWLFSFFFLWTLWNNLFSEFDAKRLLRSLAVLFGTAFLLKHLILAAFAAPEESGWYKLINYIFEGIPRAVLGIPNFAPATGYISFFALALYVLGLLSLPYAVNEPVRENEKVRRVEGEITSL